VFDRPDKSGDVIRKGAFQRALERAREVPVLWQHRAGAVIGRIEHLSEDMRGLRVIAAVGDARASRLLGSGKVDGLSFGYRVREAKSAGAHRELVELDLVDLALSGALESYELSFESGDRMRGKFLVTRLEYAGDFNGERNYTLALESSGEVATL
jgi:HK97 family phage prohead protease